MEKVKALYVICSSLQTIGLIMVIIWALAKKHPVFLLILVGVSGFAGFVKVFLQEQPSLFNQFGAVGGIAIILFCCLIAQEKK